MADPTHLDEVRQVLAAHKSQLMERYGAVGIGVGKMDAHTYGLVVYLRAPENLPGVPVEVDGVPVRFAVTGPIKPL